MKEKQNRWGNIIRYLRKVEIVKAVRGQTRILYNYFQFK